MRMGYFNPSSSVISNSDQNACFAPSSAERLLRELKHSQTSFSGHKIASKTFGGRAPHGPAGELKLSLKPPYPQWGRKFTISSRSMVLNAGKGEGEMEVR